jgi:hypothetical protein
MFIAHPASGIVTAYSTRKIWDREEYSSAQRAFLYVGSVIAATGADFDLAIPLLFEFSHHRSFFTHTPFFYLAITILACLISFVLKGKTRRFVQSTIFLFGASTMVHMLTDLVAAEVRLFWPFSNTYYSVLKLQPIIPSKSFIIQCLSTPALLILESTFIFLGLYYLLFKLRKDKKVFLFSSIIFGFFSTIALIFTLYFAIVL